MKILLVTIVSLVLVAIISLVAADRPQSGWLTQEEMRAAAHYATALGYSCAEYQIRPDGYVSDLMVGAPGVTTEGANLCPGGRMFSYKMLEDERFLDYELECSVMGVVDLTEWVCVRGVPTRAARLANGLD